MRCDTWQVRHHDDKVDHHNDKVDSDQKVVNKELSLHGRFVDMLSSLMMHLDSFFSSLLLSDLKLSDAHVYEH